MNKGKPFGMDIAIQYGICGMNRNSERILRSLPRGSSIIKRVSAHMAKVLHILKSEPDETVARVIEAQSLKEEVAVVSLYQDEITGHVVDWSRLVEDIFAYDRVICWW